MAGAGDFADDGDWDDGDWDDGGWDDGGWEDCGHICDEECEPCYHEHCFSCGECGCAGYCDDYQTYNLRPAETGGPA